MGPTKTIPWSKEAQNGWGLKHALVVQVRKLNAHIATKNNVTDVFNQVHVELQKHPLFAQFQFPKSGAIQAQFWAVMKHCKSRLTPAANSSSLPQYGSEYEVLKECKAMQKEIDDKEAVDRIAKTKDNFKKAGMFSVENTLLSRMASVRNSKYDEDDSSDSDMESGGSDRESESDIEDESESEGEVEVLPTARRLDGGHEFVADEDGDTQPQEHFGHGSLLSKDLGEGDSSSDMHPLMVGVGVTPESTKKQMQLERDLKRKNKAMIKQLKKGKKDKKGKKGGKGGHKVSAPKQIEVKPQAMETLLQVFMENSKNKQQKELELAERQMALDERKLALQEKQWEMRHNAGGGGYGGDHGGGYGGSYDSGGGSRGGSHNVDGGMF